MTVDTMSNFKELSLYKSGLKKSTKQRKQNMEHFMKTDFKIVKCLITP